MFLLDGCTAKNNIADDLPDIQVSSQLLMGKNHLLLQGQTTKRKKSEYTRYLQTFEGKN